MIPEGNYRCKVGAMEAIVSSKETPGLALEIEPMNNGQPGGATRIVRFWLSDAAYEYAERDLNKLLFNGDFDNPAVGVAEAEFYCKHRPFMENGVQKIDENTGEPVFREEWNLSKFGGLGDPADDKAKKDMARKWRARNGAPKTTPPPPAPPQPSSPPPPPPPPPAPAAGDKPQDMQEAWERFEEAWEKCRAANPNLEATASRWTASLQQHGTRHGKTVEDFTPDDWAQIVQHGEVPF